MTKLEKYLDKLINETRPKIVARLNRRDTCVLSSRVAHEGIQQKFPEVSSTPVIVDATVMNEAMLKLAATGRFDMEAAKESGAWIVQVTNEVHADREGLNGHMILLLQDGRRRYLLDMSLDQFARPEKGIDVKAFWIRMSREQLDEFNAGEPFILTSGNGGTIHYSRQANPKDLLNMPDWTCPLGDDLSTWT